MYAARVFPKMSLDDSLRVMVGTSARRSGGGSTQLTMRSRSWGGIRRGGGKSSFFCFAFIQTACANGVWDPFMLPSQKIFSPSRWSLVLMDDIVRKLHSARIGWSPAFCSQDTPNQSSRREAKVTTTPGRSWCVSVR